MLKQIKKIPRYLLKLLQQKNFKEAVHIIQHVKFKHVFIALAARIDRKATCVEFKDEPFKREINYFIEMLSHRKKKHQGDIYLWDFGEKQIFCNYLQLQGLIGEYLDGLFEEIYRYDWQNKKIVDVGGFVGDTALYFLFKGAKTVAVYEPVSKNIQALKCNLKGHEASIECFQEALADQDAPILLSSNEGEGSSAFGKNTGNYLIECQGVTISSIMERHHPIDAIKIDCEGAEKHLLNMTPQEIRSIPFWIIETHSQELHENILKKFKEHGFSNSYNTPLTPTIHLLHFEIVR